MVGLKTDTFAPTVQIDARDADSTVPTSNESQRSKPVALTPNTLVITADGSKPIGQGGYQQSKSGRRREQDFAKPTPYNFPNEPIAE